MSKFLFILRRITYYLEIWHGEVSKNILQTEIETDRTSQSGDVATKTLVFRWNSITWIVVSHKEKYANSFHLRTFIGAQLDESATLSQISKDLSELRASANRFVFESITDQFSHKMTFYVICDTLCFNYKMNSADLFLSELKITRAKCNTNAPWLWHLLFWHVILLFTYFQWQCWFLKKGSL